MTKKLDAVVGGRSLLGWMTDLALITVGVFLALLADQWRENREHRQLATDALRHFAEEMRVNQQAVRQVRDYHEQLARGIETFLATDGPKTMERFKSTTGFRGVQPVIFEHTAWDLAIATRSLSYLKPDVAYAISRVYTQQQTFETYETNFAQSLFNPNTFMADDTTALARAMQIFLADVNIQEPRLLKSYETVLPRVAGNPSGDTAKVR